MNNDPLAGFTARALPPYESVSVMFEVAGNFRSTRHETVAAAAIVLALMSQMTGGDILFRQSGLFFWLFTGVWAKLQVEGKQRASANRVWALSYPPRHESLSASVR